MIGLRLNQLNPALIKIHYRENVMDMLSTELSKMSKVESELKEKLMQLQLVQDQMQEKEIEANQARGYFTLLIIISLRSF